MVAKGSIVVTNYGKGWATNGRGGHVKFPPPKKGGGRKKLWPRGGSKSFTLS